MTAGNILDEVSPLFTNVKNGVAVEENLDKLKWKLKTLTKEDLKFVATRFKADNLLGALNTENESQLSMTCVVLQLLFSGLPAEILLDDNYTTYIRRCLAHSHSSVKRLGLDELNRHVNDSKLLTLFSSNGEDELLLLVIDCLCDEDTAVGVRATKFIAQLGKNGAGRSLICQLHFAQKVIEMTRLSQTYQIRLNEALVEMSANSGETLRQLETHGYFKDLVTALKSDDILANVTHLEVITPLGQHWHGYQFFSEHGILKVLVDTLVSADSLPLTSIFYPALVQFFGVLGQKHCKPLMETYPQIFDTIFQKASESIEETIYITSIEAIGRILYTRHGKHLLMKDERMINFMKRVHEGITQDPAEWRVRTLSALTNIVHVESKDVSSEFANAAKTWFEAMGPHGFDSVADMARQPFPDISPAALQVLDAIAHMKWGQEKISKHRALMDFLFDDSKELTAESKTAKIALLKTLSSSATAHEIFDKNAYDRIKMAADDVKPNGAGVLVDSMSV
ncbi:Proteasome non-ATPase 26S subunit [Nesidiocoris tenuis]|uniref:26S proteasome non-ATPase regulatory subunit 5 n=1 Tax=Nesidiocoris tenuis TaxID=355587 RepID=A0ABN7AM63_9HEMI|nr:Proteasome non-ATPase 26S subunit [Nesidiocoris tenuis]